MSRTPVWQVYFISLVRGLFLQGLFHFPSMPFVFPRRLHQFYRCQRLEGKQTKTTFIFEITYEYELGSNGVSVHVFFFVCAHMCVWECMFFPTANILSIFLVPGTLK